MIFPSSLSRIFWMLLLAFFSASFSHSAFAWNATGHRKIAFMAWENLSEITQKKVSLLLEAHEDVEVWKKRTSDKNIPRGIFTEASIWADEIRHDARFYDDLKEDLTIENKGKNPQHRNWHYVNLPIFPEQNVEENPPKNAARGLLDTQLVFFSEISSMPEPEIAAQFFPWLLHLAGDAHQPLHVSWHPFFNTSDENGKLPTIQIAPQKQAITLHKFWDDLGGTQKLYGEALEKEVNALLAANKKITRVEMAKPVKEWIAETLANATESGFPRAYQEGSKTMLDTNFIKKAQQIADAQMIKAGFRLAFVLNQQFNFPKKHQ